MTEPSNGAPTGTNVTPLDGYHSLKKTGSHIAAEVTHGVRGREQDAKSHDEDAAPHDQVAASDDQLTSADRVANSGDLDAIPADQEIGSLDSQFEDEEPKDWAWVEEWREGSEPVPWGPGLTVAGFTLFLVASAVYVLSSGLSDRPVLAIGVNVVVAGGLGPALWLSRGLPVLRWIAGGAVVGVLAAWASVLIFLT